MVATVNGLDLKKNVLGAGVSTRKTSVGMQGFAAAEEQFVDLLTRTDLDAQVSQCPQMVETLEAAIAMALPLAYGNSLASGDDAAHRFLQRILYLINRLNLFWYDDLQHYKNERSLYLQWVRDRIESVWQAWELKQLDIAQLQQQNVPQTLEEWCAADLTPPVSDTKRFLRETLDREGYRRLLAIVSLDGLVEASRMCRILGGASNEVQTMLFRVLLEEYGNGHLARKHSTFFAKMMAEMDLSTVLEDYFDLAPWQFLASINHNFLLTECKRHFLRYSGGLTYFEIAGPSIYTDYLMAAQRLNLSESSSGYWALHIREDERHGQWMLKGVALPLANQYADQSWELLLGYAQEKSMAERAGQAVVQQIQQADTPLPAIASV